MSDMVETVARAIWECRRVRARKDGFELEAWGEPISIGGVGDGEPAAILNGVMDEARAAIIAMEEPSKAMADQAGLSPIATKAIWQAMIRTALTEEPAA